MKKITYFLSLMLTITLATISCTKDGTNTTIENPAKTTISNNLVVDSVVTLVNSSWEFGNKFYSSKNGKITKLGCRTPEIGSYRVSLWDFSTQNLITATTIAITDTSQFKYNDISPVDITANTRYVISINNTSGGVAKRYYIYFNKTNITNIYPFTTGSITYETVQEKSSSISIFPEVVNGNDQKYFAGIPDFQFEYEE
ncbi:MAG: DUF4082 domain-containing protein [Bacteroidetes bacterium]|nr:DUF4082 domain-containing protein [Bacteroidota bacterium]